MDVKVEGAEKLALLGKAIRRMGTDRTIINNLSKDIKKMVGPVRTELRDSAIKTLPKRGGLNKWVARSRVNALVRRGVKTAGLSIREGRNSSTGKRTDLRRINAGTVRHPLFGDRHHWYLEKVEPGFATKVFDGPVVEEFTHLTLDAIDKTIAEVLHGF